MVFACGVDIEEIERFDKHYFKSGKLSDLAYDIFTSKEIENYSIFGKEAFLKGFSFKEAFYKALNNPDVGFHDIEIIFDRNGMFQILKSKFLNDHLKREAIVEIKANYEISRQYVIFKVLLIK